MEIFTAGVVSIGLMFAAAFWLMLLIGVVHGVVPAAPAIGFWKSFVVALLYGGFHNAATWPGAGHKIEDV